ncbi:hypothetical protein WG954_08760 [Lacibacter sp. H375]|uniref:hypothetical protein n=1 Tax=Lacibacter sp. H375 TaxID=3133424 RepID=UPI0030BD22FA
MKTTCILFFLLFHLAACAQQQSFDIFTFTPPKKWTKAAKENSLLFSTTDNSKRTWAQIDFVKSTASKGTIDADFQNEWKELVMNRYGVQGEPLATDTQTFNGWKLYTGLGKFLFNNDTSTVLLNTFSDGVNCASFLLLSNTTTYGQVLDEFIASLNVSLPNTNKPQEKPVEEIKTTPTNDGFTFNSTNFDDGWTSVVKEDWVEATKGNIKVLLHYPRAEDSKYYSQYDEHVNVFWNLLVAPRYTNLRQYQTPGYNHASEPGLFAAGLLNDNATKRDVWVALFSKGRSGWIEVIAPDKNSFVQAFGIDNPDRYFSNWDPLLRLTSMNRFAVGENDLVGKWSNEFSGSTSYYSVYTGLYTGSTTYASRVNYVFQKNKTYTWDLAMGSGATGTTMKVDQAKANGTWKLLSNWQVWCSDIERRPITYNAYFSCIKGARILWLQDVSYGSYTAYGKVSN